MAYDLDAAVKYYKDLLLFQYGDKPKAMATTDLLVRQALVDFLYLHMNDAFDIDTAVGDQLDILGEYIGFSRLVPIEIPQPYFQLDDYFEVITDPVGMTDYTDPDTNENSVFYLYLFKNTSFNDLNDEQYRFMLKLKSAINLNPHTLASIDQAMFKFFGTSVAVFDQKDMTLTYVLQGVPGYLLLLAVQLDLLPRPMGVRISVVFLVSDVTKIFMMADYTFDVGVTGGLCDYSTGFNDMILLNYQDRIA